MIEAEGRRGGQQHHVLPSALRRDGHAERGLAGAADAGLHEVHLLREVRAVEPHRLQRGAAEQRRPLGDGGCRIHTAVHGLLRQADALHLRRLRVGALLQPFDLTVQLVPQRLQPPDQRRQLEGAVKIFAYLAEGQTQVLQDADGAELHKSVDGIIAVPGGTVPDVRPDEAELLVIEEGAARDAERSRQFADRK